MSKYIVDLRDFGTTTVTAENRFDAVRKAAKELGCDSLALAYLASLASVRKEGAISGRPPKLPRSIEL